MDGTVDNESGQGLLTAREVNQTYGLLPGLLSNFIELLRVTQPED